MRIATLVTGFDGLSLGLKIMALIMIASAVMLIRGDSTRSDGLTIWVFSPTHHNLYAPRLEATDFEGEQPDLRLMSKEAIQSKMMSGFFAGLPTADLIECERAFVGRVFTGPLESVGFVDLTDRLEAEGLIDQINPASFGPWSTQGRIFGLPHDVHPMMLAYRADIVEAAGIDPTQAETWEEFFELMAPLMEDKDGDGQRDRWALSFWYSEPDHIESILLQGGGQLFDNEGRPTINSPRNAELLATMVSWCVGPTRIAADIDDFSAAGHQQRIEGYAIAYLCPDWMCSIWKSDVPQIGGLVKVMPMPAFERGGRRTSVWGGTMLGIPRTSESIDEAWEVAKLLYTSPGIARELYQTVDIITPVVALWDDPIYDQPDPFFSGQAKGRMYIDLAPDVPTRSSSPYNRVAIEAVRDAATTLSEIAQTDSRPEALEADAMRLLNDAQRQIERVMSRNAFASSAE